jgi:hypothetical protein
MISVRVIGSDGIILHYGDSIEAGFGGSGPTIITPYVTFPVKFIKPYIGNQITKVRIGLWADAKDVTLYIKHAPQDQAYIYHQKLGALSKGWNEVTLDTPFALTGEAVAIGYKASFAADKSDGVGYSTEYAGDANTIFWNSQSKWTTVTGSLCIEAVASGDKLPQNEFALKLFTDDSFTYGTQTSVTGEVRNWGANDASSYQITYRQNGAQPVVKTIAKEIAAGKRDTFEISVPLSVIGENRIVVSLSKVNNVDDAFPDNNTDSVTVDRYDRTYMNRLLVEEGTGNWCKFCVEGIVRIDLMKEAHPEQFVPVCIHVDDPMTIGDTSADYGSLIARFTGYPECFVNRKDLCQDVFGSLENYYKLYMGQRGHFGLTMTGTYNTDSTQVDLDARMISDALLQKPGYYMSFVVLEDSVTGYKQMNGYAGGSSGSFFGWENKPTYVTFAYNDVARWISNTFDGQLCTPETMAAGQPYDFKYTLAMPTTVQRKRKVHIVGVVIDHATGYVVNAINVVPAGSDVEAVGTLHSGKVCISRTGETLRIVCPQDTQSRVEVFSVDGRLIKEDVARGGMLEMSTTGLHGLYMMKVTGSRGAVRTYKVMI